jgi:DNA-binding MarR family transcriptional regulator
LPPPSPPSSTAAFRRTADEHDLRRKLLVITDEGRQLLTERSAAGYEHLADLITDRMNDAEQKHLSKSLMLLRRLID